MATQNLCNKIIKINTKLPELFQQKKFFMRDLILITAYCPTIDKKNMLIELLTFLKNYKDLFDIMVVSHSPLDLEYQRYCNYLIYDEENLLIYDDELRPKLVFSNENFFVNTNYASKFNTTYAVLKLEAIGVSIAKCLNYTKIHKLEYDSKLSDISEIVDNSVLLDSTDVVFYTENADINNIMSGSIWSCKNDSLPYFYYHYERKKVLQLLYENEYSSAEDLVKKYFTEKKFTVKDCNKLKSNGVEVSLSHKNFSDRGLFVVPVINNENNYLTLFSYNNRDIKMSIKAFYNNKMYKFELEPNVWRILNFSDLSIANKLMVWVNDNLTINVEFEKIDLNKFKKYNYLQKK